MNQQNPSTSTIYQPLPSEFSKTRRLFQLMFLNWKWFLIILTISLAIAVIYTKYTLPVYKTNTTVLIDEGENSTFPGLENNMLEGFGIRPGAANLDNQMLIISSRTMIKRALDELPFSRDIYKKGLGEKLSYFPDDPINLVTGPEGIPENTEFIFQHELDDTYRLSVASGSIIDIDTLISFGQEIKTDDFSLTILPHPDMEEIYKSGERIYIYYYNEMSLIEAFQQRIEIDNATEDGTILDISIEGTNQYKDAIFLDKLVEIFMRSNLEKKNDEAMRIIDFINEQLVDVTDSLRLTENQLQEFRSKNKIMDVSAQAQQLIDQSVLLENEKARLTLEANYYNYLEEYLSQENNQEVPIAPSTMGIDDPNLGSLMQELANLQAEYFSREVGDRNPLQSQTEIRILNTKRSLRETLLSIKRANSMALTEANDHIRRLDARASGLPLKERQLLGFERKFNLNNELYTFLLQKSAEAQIQKASNRPDNERIDLAGTRQRPVAPNVLMIYLLAIVLGVGLPFMSIITRDAMRSKISSEEEIKMITDKPIIGHIPHSRLSYNTVVLTEPQSRIAESFRNLRTRLEFITRDKKSPVILMTSSMPGDGKTFSAINLASAYSLTGKKTLVIGFDLRKPTLAKSMGIENTGGLSSYLIGKSELDDVIVESGFDNLHIIPSGSVPPNPGELSSSEKVSQMFEKLKKKYDFIIVDTAPIGAVADSYYIASLADANIILVRHAQTNKHFLKATLNEADSNGIKGISLLVNDFRSTRASYHQYAYNYKKYNYKTVKQ